jgi:hypothetical protein
MQKAAVRIKTRPTSQADGEEPPSEVSDPIDAVVNESFNRDAFESFRGALDDIAKELGQRKSTGSDVAVQVNVIHEHTFQDDPEAAGIARSLLRRVGNRGSAGDPGGFSVAGE